MGHRIPQDPAEIKTVWRRSQGRSFRFFRDYSPETYPGPPAWQPASRCQSDNLTTPHPELSLEPSRSGKSPLAKVHYRQSERGIGQKVREIPGSASGKKTSRLDTSEQVLFGLPHRKSFGQIIGKSSKRPNGHSPGLNGFQGFHGPPPGAKQGGKAQSAGLNKPVFLAAVWRN